MWWKRKVKYINLKLDLDLKISKFFEESGFQSDKKEDYYLIYRRETEFGFEIFELEYLILTKEMKIGFGLRYNEVEEIYDQIHQIESRENSYSLYIDSEELLHYKVNELSKARFKFEKNEDIEIGLNNTMYIFTNYAKEYYEKYNSISKFSQLVNREKQNDDLRGNFAYHGNRGDIPITGIIASRLLNESDTENLIKQHLSNSTDETLEFTFNKIDEYFKS